MTVTRRVTAVVAFTLAFSWDAAAAPPRSRLRDRSRSGEDDLSAADLTCTPVASSCTRRLRASPSVSPDPQAFVDALLTCHPIGSANMGVWHSREGKPRWSN